MQRAVRDRGHVGVFHIFRANAIKNLAVNANMFKGSVTAAADAGGMYAQAANHDKGDDQHGAGQEENLDLFRHQDRPFYFLYKTKERLQGELPLHYSYLFWMQLSFPTEQKNLRLLPLTQLIPAKERSVRNFLRVKG